jgi:glycosyltransferase involved in cell wall biosynthesis
MRILYITRAGFGAMGEAATYQYASITARHHDVLVLAPCPPQAKEKIVFFDPAVEVADIYSPDLIEQVDNVFKHIQHFRPEVIHMIQSPYCFHYPYYLRHLTPYSKWIIDFRSPHVGGKKDRALYRYFVLQFYVDAILTHFMPSLKTNIHIRLRKAYEIPPGVDLSLFENKERDDFRRHNGNFVFAGSLNERRKLEFLVSAFGEFCKRGNREARLDIFGAGNAEEKLKRYLEENSLQQWVFLRGALPQQDLFGKLKNYDAGIAYVPYEHFSLAPSLKSLEYAAAGIPVLASDTEGHKIYNKKYGFRFKLFRNTVEDFCTALSDIAYKPANKEDVFANSRAAEYFDWKSIIRQKLLPIYAKLGS